MDNLDSLSTHTHECDENEQLVTKKKKSSETAFSLSAANIVAQGMNNAIAKLVERKKNSDARSDDKYSVFGDYIASELRSIINPDIAKKIQFKLNRTLIDSNLCEISITIPAINVANWHIISSIFH